MGCEVDYCCCCVPLQDGVLILGYLRLFGGVFFFIMTSVGISVYNSSQTYTYPILVITLVWTIAQAIYMISTALLILVGIYQKKPAAIRAYCWMSIIILIWEILFFIVLGLIDSVYFAALPVIIIFAGVDIYFFFVFRSSFLAMKREKLSKPAGAVRYDRPMETLQNHPATSTFTIPEQSLININN